MGTVHAFKRQQPDQATLTGPAMCIACKNEWEAVAPVGTQQLECPNCSSHRGIFKHPVGPTNSRFVCNCGSELFFLLPDGMMCRECGVMAQGF